MSMTLAADEINNNHNENPGSFLAHLREKKGISQEYVAGKLHLRIKIIELLEADDYQSMPEPVFIKGYLRAYAKLLGVSPDPLLETFNNRYASERKVEKALWQSKRESNFGERMVRWFTVLVVLAAVIAVGIWWHTNKDAQPFFAIKEAQTAAPATQTVASKSEQEQKLTDLSRMQSMFAVESDDSSETHSG
ncbi:helix-turn-helix domain-containing protein [Legionella dresdenensis]|uniref:Helix-turn-helix domain-containing protein n=1 Tax=Legionella dresdenensis TaxID=450200 RepID=A0ABV8CBQ5_9GAMM